VLTNQELLNVVGIVDTTPKSTRGVEVVDTDQQCFTPTSTYVVSIISRLRSRAHIANIGRKVSEVHLRVHLAFVDHSSADPMVDGLSNQWQIMVCRCDSAYSVLRRKAADCPAGGGEAYNQLQSVDSGLAAALLLEEEHCTAVLGSFRVVEGVDRCCILDIAVEEEVRFRSYFQIST
jgi:hypothetical protein